MSETRTGTLSDVDREVLIRISEHEPIHTDRILANGRLGRQSVLDAIGNLTEARLIGCNQRGWYVLAATR